MASSLRTLLLGPAENSFGRYLGILFAVMSFVATFAAYALGVFDVAGCVVLIPGHAAMVGVLSAGAVGYSRGGLAFGWLVAYAPLLGYHADHAFLGLSGRSFSEQLAYFLEPDGLAFLAVEGAVLGTLAFAAGYLGRWAVKFVQGDSTFAGFE